MVREGIDPRLTASLFANYRSATDAVLELVDNAVDSRVSGRPLRVGGTTWHEMAGMPISVSNWSTSEADADLSVAAILRCRDTVADAHRSSGATTTEAH